MSGWTGLSSDGRAAPQDFPRALPSEIPRCSPASPWKTHFIPPLLLGLTHSLTDSFADPFPPNIVIYTTRLLRLNRCHLCHLRVCIFLGARDLQFWENVHLPPVVMCHVSNVTFWWTVRYERGLSRLVYQLLALLQGKFSSVVSGFFFDKLKILMMSAK